MAGGRRHHARRGARGAANAALDRAAGRANGIAAITPERVIREGDPTEQILDVIDKDVDISMLVLAANPGAEGPGPIITTMAKTAGAFPIPVVDRARRPERRRYRRPVVSAFSAHAAWKGCP